ncbi:MAG: HNH endonuclease [Phycisphaerales bacterium]
MQEWLSRRRQVLEYDNFKCQNCGRTQDNTQSLHVHHKRYVNGRRMWEYGLEDLVTLCARCHQREHFPLVVELERLLRDGRSVPTFGWEQFDIVDLEEATGDCEYCLHERPIRYEHHLWHPCGEVLVTGCVHAAELTGEDIKNQKQLESIAKNFARALSDFCDNSKWKPDGHDLTRRYRGSKYFVRIMRAENGFRASVNNYLGKYIYASQREAMTAVYSRLRDGSFDSVVDRIEQRPADAAN